MDIKTCRICKRIFNYISGDIVCPACKEKEEEVFQEVKKYIQENKGATESEVCEEFDVSSKTIRRWVTEGRLEVTKGSPLCPHCRRCGAEILSGELCEDCQKADARNANALMGMSRKPVVEQPKKPERDGNKMRFLDTGRR